MSLPTKAKVVIIGGGIHGLSTAWKLSETYKNPGDIIVLEKKDTAAGASGIACGVVRNNYFQPAMRELMAHSVEVWENNTLLGGLYGVSLGAAFFAESMFSTSNNGSKFALVALMFLLIKNKFLLLDVQFMTKHLATMGAIEVPKTEFLERLKVAKAKIAYFKKVNSTSIDINLQNTLTN